MNKYRHSKTSLFLMEIMLDILFFSVLVTICLQLFFKAHNLSEDTTVLHRAVSTCTSVAEVYQSGENGKESIFENYIDAVERDQNIVIYFDEKFASCPEEKSAYQAQICVNDDSLHTAVIEFLDVDAEEMIYTLTVSAYEPKTLAESSGGDADE